MVVDPGLVFIDCPDEVVQAFSSAEQFWFGGAVPRQEEQLQIVITSSLRTPELRRFRDDPSPLLLVGILAGQVTLGPLQIKGRSACLACLQYWAVTAGWDLSDHSFPGINTKSIELAIQRLSDFLTEFQQGSATHDWAGFLTLIDVISGLSTRHPIFPRKSCPSCCNLSAKEPKDLSVHCSSVTGIVKQLECFVEPIAGVFQAGALVVGPLLATRRARSFEQTVSWGRGTSPQQASDSCIGEALEFYSIAYRGNEKMNRARLTDTPAGIDPRNILLYSEAQYESRHHSNQFLSERHRIPEAFDCARPLDWLPGSCLADGKPAWVPAACCLLHYQYRPDEPKFAIADRVGCAVGVSYSDALAGALLELIEHDAVAIWWYNQIQRPEIELESFDSPVVLAVRDALAPLKRKLWILDVSTDIGIPAYVAVSTLNDGRELLFGSAANPSPKIAAEKAATEVAHLWMCMRIATMPTDFIPWLRTATLKNQPYFVPLLRLASLPEPGAMTSVDIVGLCTERLRRSRLDPIAINLTRSDVTLHAVRVVAPGIRYTRNRRAPGRLYDLPVKLGWLQKPRLETELNPICCVF